MQELWHNRASHIPRRPYFLFLQKAISTLIFLIWGSEVSKSPGDYLTCAGEQAGHYITRGLPADSDLVSFKLTSWMHFNLLQAGSRKETRAGGQG